MSFYDKLKFTADGLIPAIIQERSTGRALMMAWMNRASLETTIATGKTHFWSRSRQKFWMKGESSGHTQAVKELAFDCDGDTLLVQVDQIGAACHEGYKSCFFRRIDPATGNLEITETVVMQDGDSVIERLHALKEIGVRRAMGARRRDIRRQFLLEAALLSAIGGLIGAAHADRHRPIDGDGLLAGHQIGGERGVELHGHRAAHTRMQCGRLPLAFGALVGRAHEHAALHEVGVRAR